MEDRTMEMEERTMERKRRTFTAAEVVMAWALLLLGYGLLRIYPLKYYPFGALLWTLAMLAVTLVYLYRSGSRLTVRQWAYPALAALLSLTYLVTDNSAIHAWAFFLTAVGYLVWLLRVSGNGLETETGELLLPEVVKAAIVMPFSRFGAVCSAWFRPRDRSGKRGKAGMTVLWVFVGLCAAVIPVFIVIVLLGYDESFNRIFDRLLHLRLGDELFSRLLSLILAVPVAMFLFGALLGNREHVASERMSKDACARFVTRLRFLPRPLMAAFLAPLLVVYALFFFSQMPYYVSAFSGVLPEGMSYADYARSGFFQLCTVCGINAGVTLVCMAFCKRKEGFDAVRMVFVVLLALSSILLAVTALSKMLLYIGSYGLTPRRVYTSWLMLLLICCFVAVIVRMFVARMNLNRAIACTFAAFFLLLALCNPGARIARYNVDKYLSGAHETVDINAMYELGDAAVPQVYRLWKETAETDAEVRARANWYLDEMSRTMPAQSDPVLSFSLPSLRAQRTLAQWRAESGSLKP